MRNLIAAIGLTSMLVSTTASGQAAPTPRGEQLYSVYCNGCHTTEVHWRAKKLAFDMPSLKSQVRRWQDNIALGWSEDEVAAVALYLNDRYYRFPSALTKRTESANHELRMSATRRD